MLLRRSLIAGSLGAAVLVAFVPADRFSSLSEPDVGETSSASLGFAEEPPVGPSDAAAPQFLDSSADSQQVLLKSRPSLDNGSVWMDEHPERSLVDVTGEEVAIGQSTTTESAPSNELYQLSVQVKSLPSISLRNNPWHIVAALY